MSLSSSQIIQWFRDKAAEFNKVADSLENTFKDGTPNPSSQSGIQKPKSFSTPLTTFSVFDFVKAGRAVRPGKIAAHFGVTIEQVQAVISTCPESFERVGRGWIKAGVPPKQA